MPGMGWDCIHKMQAIDLFYECFCKLPLPLAKEIIKQKSTNFRVVTWMTI
jgi:hypothetical protein